MRALTLLIVSTGLFLSIEACSSNDGTATDDSSEINEGRGLLEKDLKPQLDPPKSDLIGAKMDDVWTKALGDLTAPAGQKDADGCTNTSVKDPKTKEIVLERVECKNSDVIRTFNDDGSTNTEHYDLNKDSKVDRYTGVDGAVVQYADSNFDGIIDSVIERVDKVTDFSLKGYDDTSYPKSAFLYRVREDSNHDGKLDHEKLTARGILKPADSE
jgi:hypothetical protein